MATSVGLESLPRASQPTRMPRGSGRWDRHPVHSAPNAARRSSKAGGVRFLGWRGPPALRPDLARCWDQLRDLLQLARVPVLDGLLGVGGWSFEALQVPGHD